MRRVLVPSACALLVACANGPVRPSAAAQRAAATGSEQIKLVAVNAKPASKDPKSEVVCRKETMTGSYLPVRRCYTRAQLDEMREEAQRVFRGRTNTDLGNSNNNGQTAQ